MANKAMLSLGSFCGRGGRVALISMDIPEELRILHDVTIRVREPRPGFFEANFHPTSPETHLARSGFTIDTKRGLRAQSMTEALDWAEAHWRQNYPS
jgi:hypothetical protein